jgi:hypothetical protein
LRRNRNLQFAVRKGNFALLDAVPNYVAAFTALALLPGQPRSRHLQDRFNTGLNQDVDEFTYGHTRGLEQFQQGEQQLAVFGQIPRKTLAIFPVHNLVRGPQGGSSFDVLSLTDSSESAGWTAILFQLLTTDGTASFLHPHRRAYEFSERYCYFSMTTDDLVPLCLPRSPELSDNSYQFLPNNLSFIMHGQ